MREGDFCQTAAEPESVVSDRIHTGRNRDSIQIGAAGKGLQANSSQALGQNHFCELCGNAGPIIDIGNAVGNREGGPRLRGGIYLKPLHVLVIQNAVNHTEISISIASFRDNGLQGGAVAESGVAYFPYACGNRNLFQPGSKEGEMSNRLHGAGDGDAFQIGAVGEALGTDAGNAFFNDHGADIIFISLPWADALNILGDHSVHFAGAGDGQHAIHQHPGEGVTAFSVWDFLHPTQTDPTANQLFGCISQLFGGELPPGDCAVSVLHTHYKTLVRIITHIHIGNDIWPYHIPSGNDAKSRIIVVCINIQIPGSNTC